MLFSDLSEDKTGKFLKVKLIQKKAFKTVSPAYFFDEGSQIEWTPNSDKLSATEPGVKGCPPPPPPPSSCPLGPRVAG